MVCEKLQHLEIEEDSQIQMIEKKKKVFIHSSIINLIIILS